MKGGAPQSATRALAEAMARMLPAAVAVHQLDVGDDVSAGASTHPTEIADPARALRFHRGRTCALLALTELGSTEIVVGRGPRREPLWPAGFVGSITHLADTSTAAASRSTHLSAIGIDAEPNDPLPPGVDELIRADDTELTDCETAPDLINWPTVLFSAKESVYKTWYPTFQSWLDFQDVKVELSPTTSTTGTFRVEPNPESPMAAAEAQFVAELRGGYDVDPVAGLVVSVAFRITDHGD